MAFVAAFAFLVDHGQLLAVSQKDVETKVIELVSSRISEEDFAEWRRANCESLRITFEH